ncbi:MAG: Methyltransferase, partial [Rhizobium sp.]|nr:Methyltransferase [Rhizobium sp.]
MSRIETIGNATLYLGDARDLIGEVLNLRPTCVLSDPPFGISYKSGHATDALWAGGRSIAQD